MAGIKLTTVSEERRMEKKAVLIGALLLASGYQSMSLSDEVGLFFDDAGTVTCSNSIMVPLDVYIVAKDLTYPNAVAGWEMVLDSDANIILSGVDFMGDAINVGAFPGIMVGLAEPLVPSGSIVLLAELNIFAVGEGQLYIHGYEPPSIPGSGKPIYTVYGTNNLVEMDIYSPDGMSGQAALALDCTTPLSQTTPLLLEYEIAGSTEAVVAEGRYTMSLKAPVEEDALSRVELELYFADIAFVGQVEAVEYKCLNIPNQTTTSLALVQFRIITPICGVAGNTIVIETVVDRPENCITYDDVTLFREFVPGEQFLVAAYRIDGGRAKVPPNGIWRYNSGNLTASSGEKGARSFDSLIQKTKSNREFLSQVRKADLTAVVRVDRVWHMNDAHFADATVTKVERGICEGPNITIMQKDGANGDGDLVIHLEVKPGETYLAFLRESLGNYEPVYGRLSFFSLNERGVLEERGREWGTLLMAEAIIGGLK